MKDPFRFIREAIEHDKVLDVALAEYAEHQHPEYLAAAIDLSARVYAACVAESERRQMHHIAHQPKPTIRK